MRAEADPPFPPRSFKNPNSDPSKWLTGKELAAVYASYTEKYDIVSIEDPFDQDDWEAWTHLTATSPIQVSSDLTFLACSGADSILSRLSEMTLPLPTPSASRRELLTR